MASCQDCIHYFVCDSSGGELYESVEQLKNDCTGFKNKADFVEVVRCKDCKKTAGEAETNWAVLCTRHNKYFFKDDYCSCGEKALKEREKE